MASGKYSTNRPDEIESYITDYRREHGISPTVLEIANAIGLFATMSASIAVKSITLLRCHVWQSTSGSPR